MLEQNNSSSKRPIKILEIVDSLDAGGMEAQLVALINRLDPAKFEFQVLCLRHEGVHASRLNQGIQVHALGKSPGFRWGTVTKVAKIAREGGFDVIHTHNWAPLVYAALASLGRGLAPIFHGEHAQLNDAEKSLTRLLIRRFFYKFCIGIHTVSAGQKEELEALGLNHPRFLTLLNGVDTERFCPGKQHEARAKVGLPSVGKVIGIVARFGSYKRHAALIEAFDRLATSNPNLHLLIVGDGGPEKEAVLRQISSCAYLDRIKFAGFQSDPVPWYQAMDILVVPSSNEGLSNVTLEAMACGVPVLSNHICGSRELLGSNEGGWVQDLGTQNQLEAQLVSLLGMKSDVLQIVGIQGRKRAEHLFSWHRMASDYAMAFSDCCARGQPSLP